MKRVALSLSIAVLLAGAALIVHGQGRGDPFFDDSDTGQFVHVLPPPAGIRVSHERQSLFAPPRTGTSVYPASYGKGNLIDHGGPEIPGAGFWAIYWNATGANSTQTSNNSTLESDINAFINSFPDNDNYDGSTADDYEVIQQYGSTSPIMNTLMNWGAFVDTQATQRSISDSGVQSYLQGLFNAGKVPAYTDTIYGVYFPAGMKVKLGGGGSCSIFCGYHNHFTYTPTGQQINYAVCVSGSGGRVR